MEFPVDNIHTDLSILGLLELLSYSPILALETPHGNEPIRIYYLLNLR